MFMCLDLICHQQKEDIRILTLGTAPGAHKKSPTRSAVRLKLCSDSLDLTFTELLQVLQ